MSNLATQTHKRQTRAKTKDGMDSITIQEEELRLQRSGKHKFQKKQFLKMRLQLVVSVALLSLFLCYSSSGFPFFAHSFNVYFSTLLFSFCTHTLERKYMFLLCNGILVFLARTSISGDSQPKASHQKQDLDVVVEDDVEIAAEETNPKGDGEKVMEEPVRRGEEDEGDSDVPVVVEDVNQEEEEEEGFGTVVDAKEMEGDEAAATEEVASTEELNRKIEEFIRKMKEEIRIKAV